MATLIALSTLATACALLLLDLFTLHFGGLVGAMYTAQGGDSHTWNFRSILATLGAAHDSAPASELSLQVSFVLIFVVAPLCWQLTLLRLWTARLSLLAQRRLLALAEACYCWMALDVFLVTLLIALPNEHLIGILILQEGCAVVEDLAATYFGYLVTSGETRCLECTADVGTGTVVLIAAQLVAHLAWGLTMRTVRRLQEEEMARRGGAKQYVS